MENKQGTSMKRKAIIAKMEKQLKVWSSRLDYLVTRHLVAGAKQYDEYRIRIDELRARYRTVQSKFNDFNRQSGDSEAWKALRTAIADEWSSIKADIKDMRRRSTRISAGV